MVNHGNSFLFVDEIEATVCWMQKLLPINHVGNILRIHEDVDLRFFFILFLFFFILRVHF